MRTQHELGTVLVSGPSADGGLGIYVVRASSRDEAAALAAAEPMVIEGVGVEVIDWTVHQILGIGPFRLPDVADGGAAATA